jgi:2-polyprenyl-6-methoxyphenol hydroxylase-like FAD-dependent oxidoreductase
MSLPTRHVLIVGGGLAGPCLALSLARHNIRSTILELRPTRPTSGGSISLGPNALQVLDRYAGVYEQLKAVGYSYNAIGAYTDSGEKLGEIRVGLEGSGGYPAVRVMRTLVNGVLLDAGEKSGLVSVKYGTKVERVEEDDKGVTAYLADGSKEVGELSGMTSCMLYDWVT